MTWRRGPLTEAARVQQQLWGSDPTGWARFAEPHTRPLFEAVLAATGVTAGTRLLDVGCGSGLLLEIAQARGAAVTGLDVAPALLTAAGGRRARRRALARGPAATSFPQRFVRRDHWRQRVPVRGRPPGSPPRGGPGLPARRDRGGQHVRRAGPGRVHRGARGHVRTQPAAAAGRARAVLAVRTRRSGGRAGRGGAAGSGQRRGAGGG